MQRRKFSREFKPEAVRLVKDRGVAVAQAARDLDLHESAMCDAFDALTSVRPYKKGSSPETAAAMMATWEGHFDPMLLNKFFHCMGLQWPGRRMVVNGAAQTMHGTD